MNNFETIKVQLVLFPDRLLVPQSKRAEFIVELKKLINGNESILPIPDDAPDEIPFMFLQENNSFEISFSRKRISLTVNNQDDLISIAERLMNFLADKVVKINDVGCIITAIDEKIENPNKQFKKIANSALVSDDGDLENFLRTLVKKDLTLDNKTYKTNFSRTLSTAAQNGAGKRILLAEVDLNTFPTLESEKDFKWILVKKILQEEFKLKEEFHHEISQVNDEK